MNLPASCNYSKTVTISVNFFVLLKGNKNFKHQLYSVNELISLWNLLRNIKGPRTSFHSSELKFNISIFQDFTIQVLSQYYIRSQQRWQKLYLLIHSNVNDDRKIFEICGFMKNMNQNILKKKSKFSWKKIINCDLRGILLQKWFLADMNWEWMSKFYKT